MSAKLKNQICAILDDLLYQHFSDEDKRIQDLAHSLQHKMNNKIEALTDEARKDFAELHPLPSECFHYETMKWFLKWFGSGEKEKKKE